MTHEGFDAYVKQDSKVLILGSFPSVKSREEGFYYGNPQNRFWKLLAEAFGEQKPITVNDKKALLSAHRIALWDVVIRCEIEGSMDKDIRSPEIADIPALLSRYPIETIVTNGGTAATLMRKHYPDISVRCLSLPSTSPANARLDKSLWINTLRELL